MRVEVAPGKYVIAVSGGVDSVALLHCLRAVPGVVLTVAHLDHGIRPDAAVDRRFVAGLAERYDLPFRYHEARLGPQASEATARTARYAFLEMVRREEAAAAIITAHHQDDVLETAIINLLRGTGRKGLSALRSNGELLRPLLNSSKQDILAYARRYDLAWREDATNRDETYLRNYVRRRLIPQFSAAQKHEFFRIIEDSRSTNQRLDVLLGDLIDRECQDDTLNRPWFNRLPHPAAREVMAGWLRREGINNFDRNLIERLVIAGKTGKRSTEFVINQKVKLHIGTHQLALTGLER